MSFQTGLSGLNASSQSLDVIGNNIANANTVGMKSSRAEFSNLVASAIGAGGTGAVPGIGVAVATISQEMTQGNLSITGNALDVAINGGGFFQVTKGDGTTAYTRDGQFKLDKDGNIITNNGSYLMGYPTDQTGATTAFTTQKLAIPTGAPIPAKPTDLVTAEFNLDARTLPVRVGGVYTNTNISPTQYGTSIITYDAQGVEIPLNLYFVHTDTDKWNVYDNQAYAAEAITGTGLGPNGITLDSFSDQALPPSAGALFQLEFDTNGTLKFINSAAGTGLPISTTQNIALQSSNTNIGLFQSALDLSKATQFGVNYAISNLSQSGYTSGAFTGLTIDGTGIITTRYSNGQTLKDGGMIALADFRNVQGLVPIGGGEYQETFNSGAAVMGQPTVGRFGELRAGSVEDSNVDLTAELVNMMTAQRNYQANAQTIKTQDQIMSTLVNLR